MHLVIAATQFEMDAFNDAFKDGLKDVLNTDDSGSSADIGTFVCGVGPVESAVCVTKYLAAHHMKIDAVVNFGIGGAYLHSGPQAAAMLDICVAESEVLGDFGVCLGNETETFSGTEFPVRNKFDLDRRLLKIAQEALTSSRLDFRTGTFVTVNGASGSGERGDFLSARHDAICENMEGAAIARTCAEFGLPFAEVRAISNLVEDRPGSEWKIDEACQRAARAASFIVQRLRVQRLRDMS